MLSLQLENLKVRCRVFIEGGNQGLIFSLSGLSLVLFLCKLVFVAHFVLFYTKQNSHLAYLFQIRESKSSYGRLNAATCNFQIENQSQ